MEARSKAPKTRYRTPETIEQEVIRMKKEHEGWGKQRIADELAKINNWVPLVSRNTVRRILRDAGLWSEASSQAKKRDNKAAPVVPTSPDKR